MHQPGKIFIFLKNENALLFTKVPIWPTKTGGSYVSVFDLQIIFLYIFLFTWMCTHFVQNIAALFSLSLKIPYLPLFLWKSGILYCGHLNAGGRGRGREGGHLIICIKLVSPAACCPLVWWFPLLQSSKGFHCALLRCKRFGIKDLISCGGNSRESFSAYSWGHGL